VSNFAEVIVINFYHYLGGRLPLATLVKSAMFEACHLSLTSSVSISIDQNVPLTFSTNVLPGFIRNIFTVYLSEKYDVPIKFFGSASSSVVNKLIKDVRSKFRSKI
jgi:hypothetical protein